MRVHVPADIALVRQSKWSGSSDIFIGECDVRLSRFLHLWQWVPLGAMEVRGTDVMLLTKDCVRTSADCTTILHVRKHDRDSILCVGCFLGLGDGSLAAPTPSASLVASTLAAFRIDGFSFRDPVRMFAVECATREEFMARIGEASRRVQNEYREHLGKIGLMCSQVDITIKEVVSRPKFNVGERVRLRPDLRERGRYAAEDFEKTWTVLGVAPWEVYFYRVDRGSGIREDDLVRVT
ncbi:hypothetical protein HYV74_03670 [Candidatus Uhrbacteria bacterium]|nr:hypothetical protein [Candidatus Uhrbacteria bacterium]